MDAGSSKQPRGALLVANLPSLQFLIKRDPKSYVEEFAIQWNAYNAARALLESSAASKAAEDKWRELVGFIAQVAPCYPNEAKDFPSHLSALLLNTQASNLSPDTRKTLVQSLVLLKNKGMLSRIELLKILFPLLGMTASPNLRSFILKSILQDIKQANKKAKNHKLNRLVQSLLFDMVRRGTSENAILEGTGTKAARKNGNTAKNAAVSGREAMLAVKLASELWRKQIWTDEKTVQIVAEACFHPNTKVTSAAIHFFLRTPGDDLPEDSDDEQEENLPDIKQMYHQSTINKTRRSTKRKEKQTVKQINKKRKRTEAEKAANANIPALQLLLDPQTFAERLYDSLAKNDRLFTLEHKVLMMQLFGRVTGVHSLTVLGFYSFATKYLTHHQAQVTAILVAVAQSVHSLTPPDVLLPVVRKLAHEFIHPGVNAEVIAAGLNAVREICRRQPLAMEHDLLEDLIDYRKSKDKGVMTAARSLLQLYREVCPSMLRKRERGKLATMNATGNFDLHFGQDANNVSTIAGLDLLQAHMDEKAASGELPDPDDDTQWQGWEENSADDQSSDESENGWINVNSDGDSDIHISDSDDEGRQSKKSRADKTASQIAADESESDDAISIQLKDSDSDDSDAEGAASDDTDPGDTLVPADDQDEGLTSRNLAAEQILTPADFARMDQLQLEAAEKAVADGGGSAARRKLQALAAAKKAAAQNGEFLSEAEIIGVRKRVRDTYEERMASIQAGREGREKFGSRKGQHKAEKGSSTTNYEKRKTKNFMMTLHSSKVKSKKNASLRDKQKKLRGHITKQKKKHK